MKNLVAAFALIVLSSSVAVAANFDGTWSGKWGATPTTIRVKGDKVVSYYFDNRGQRIGRTTVNGKVLTFGSGYTIKMTLTGANTAKASYQGYGRTNKASLVRH